MKLKILVVVLLYLVLVILAGNAIWSILFLLSVPALAYAFIKFFIIEAPGNFVSKMFYGDKTTLKPVRELSKAHMLIVNNQFKEAFDFLNSLQSGNFEIEMLKMELLYEHFKDFEQALIIGFSLLKSKNISHLHGKVLGTCFEIYLECEDYRSASLLLDIYGPKLPSQTIVNDKLKRLNSLQKMAAP